MRANTARAIKALLRMDSTVTREMRMGIVEIIETCRGQRKARGDMSVPDAAALLGLSRITVWQMCKDGRIKAERRGRKFFVNRDAIEAVRREVA